MRISDWSSDVCSSDLVQRSAEAMGIPVRTPRSLRDARVQAEFADLRADAAIVAAYGLILPQPILDAPRLGCINIHGSLLPRWRGAAPIQRSILAGDAETGITIMQMDAGLDTGPTILSERVPIGPRTTASRSEEHTSELQSLMRISYDLFCLKKKNNSSHNYN